MFPELIDVFTVIFLYTGSLASFVIILAGIVYMGKQKKGQGVCAKREVIVTNESEDAENEIAVTKIEDNAVVFSADKSQTLEEKYEALDKENKKYYDEVIGYAGAVEGVKCFKNNRYEEYKVGSYRVVRLNIKRGIIHCEFSMHNSDFKNYVAENKVSVKHSATVIKITSAETVKAIKDSIDIVVANIANEKAFKKQLAREKRRERRLQQKG